MSLQTLIIILSSYLFQIVFQLLFIRQMLHLHYLLSCPPLNLFHLHSLLLKHESQKYTQYSAREHIRVFTLRLCPVLSTIPDDASNLAFFWLLLHTVRVISGNSQL